MKRYFIKLKKGSQEMLSEVIQKYLNTDEQEAEALIRGGSVWNVEENKRLIDPALLITEETLKINKPLHPDYPYELPEEFVIYEDDVLLVVYKEAGLASHPTPYSQVECLAYGAREYVRRREKNETITVSVINRLDRPTRGLLLLSRGKKAEASLHALFREKKVSKTYLAVTPALEVPPLSLRITDTLEWNGKEKPAETRLRYHGRCGEKDVFFVFPRTGRTHQIRKHFARYLAPLWGDSRYGSPYKGPLGLICFSYSFVHPLTGEKMRITLPRKCLEEMLFSDGEKKR